MPPCEQSARARVHADRVVVGAGHRAGWRRDAPRCAVPVAVDFVDDRGTTLDVAAGHVRRLLDGRATVPAARARPTRGGRAARAGERVAGHRRRSRARSTRRGRRTTRTGHRARRRRPRSSNAGSRSRCSRRSRATGPASTTGAAANTVERLTHQLRVLGQGVQPSNWDRLGELRMPMLLIVGELDTKYVEHRPPHGRRDPRRARRGARRRRPRVPPRAAGGGRSPARLLVAREPDARVRRRPCAPAARRRPGRSGSRGHVAGERGRAWRARTRTAAPGARRRARRRRRCPTDVSIIDVTTAGTPARRATSSAARTPPSGCCLSTITSAASSARNRARVVERADALVGRDRHGDARGGRARGRRASRPVARRIRGRSARGGRSSSPRCRRPTRRWRRRAPRHAGPTASRTAATRRVPGRVAHLHLHRRERRGASATAKRPVDERVHGHRRRAPAGGKPTQRGLLGGRAGTPRDRTGSPAAASTRPSPPGPRAG